MSYDIDFGVKVEGTDKIVAFDRPEYRNPTYNVSDILRKSMEWEFEQGEWYRIDKVYGFLQRGLYEVEKFPYKYKKFEPINGWGDVGTVREVLQSILDKIEDIERFKGLTKDQFYITW